MSNQLGQALSKFLDEHKDTELSLNLLMSNIGPRPIDAAIFIFSLPNIVLPGISFLFAIPIAFFSIQNIWRRGTPKLPRFLQNIELNRPILEATVKALNWISGFTNGYVKSRWPFMTTPVVLAIVNFEIFILALLLFLPVPFGNTPPALAICILAFGMMEDDGLIVSIGALVGLFCIAICMLLLFLGAEITLFLFGFFVK